MTATTMATKSVRVFNREQDIIIVQRFVRRVHANVRCVKECRLGSCRFMSHVNMWQARGHTFFRFLGMRRVRRARGSRPSVRPHTRGDVSDNFTQRRPTPCVRDDVICGGKRSLKIENTKIITNTKAPTNIVVVA